MRTSKSGLYNLPSGVTKPMIPKGKVASFIKLFELIKKSTGTYAQAENLCKVSHKTIFNMRNNNYLSKDTAAKILEAYNKIK